MDIQKLEDEQNFKFRGFREVIDLLSSSQKPIISYNCLNGRLTHNQLAQLYGLLTSWYVHMSFFFFFLRYDNAAHQIHCTSSANMHEFMCSLKMVFSNVVDISHLWRQIGPLRKAKNTQAALSYLQRQYFVPIEIEIPQQGIIPANIIHTSCFLVNHALRSPSYFTK